MMDFPEGTERFTRIILMLAQILASAGFIRLVVRVPSVYYRQFWQNVRSACG